MQFGISRHNPHAGAQFLSELRAKPLPTLNLATFEATPADRALLSQFMESKMNETLARLLLTLCDPVERQQRIKSSLHESSLAAKICVNPVCPQRFSVLHGQLKRKCPVKVMRSLRVRACLSLWLCRPANATWCASIRWEYVKIACWLQRLLRLLALNNNNNRHGHLHHSLYNNGSAQMALLCAWVCKHAAISMRSVCTLNVCCRSKWTCCRILAADAHGGR